MSQPRVLFVAQYILVEGAMHYGKKAQCILVKSDEFENRTPFYIFFLNPVYVAARSLRSLRWLCITSAVLLLASLLIVHSVATSLNLNFNVILFCDVSIYEIIHIIELRS